MDDPFKSLDRETSDMVFEETFFDVLKHKTRILVTHDVEIFKRAQRIVVMKEGRIVGDGTFERLQDERILEDVLSVHRKNMKIYKEPLFELEIPKAKKSKSQPLPAA